MDIITHAVVGGITGAAFGHPIAGSIVAMIQDLPLFGYIKGEPTHPKEPSNLYRFLHSFLFLIILTLVCYVYVSFIHRPFNVPWFVFWVLLSHFYLDFFTHRGVWTVRLFWPWGKTFKSGGEWEFFNRAWLAGIGFAVIWSFVWLQIPYGKYQPFNGGLF